MDDRRFDSITKALATGKNRRSVLKGLLGLGGATLAGGALLDNDAEAARRPAPTPKPVACPGRQTRQGGVCTCPADAPNKCGPDCCTGSSSDPYPRSPSHTECCDNACCDGTCYGEELCCPTNMRPGELPPTHILCEEQHGLVCVEGNCCDDSDCPGCAHCNAGSCVVGCNDDESCCNGACHPSEECQGGNINIGVITCLDLNTTGIDCTAGIPCCTGLSCEDGGRCCVPSNGACSSNADCCTNSTCLNTGVCS